MKTIKTIQNVGLLLALALGGGATGCLFEDDPVKPGPGPDPDHPVDAAGMYKVQSTFDLMTVPGTAGAVSDALSAATDGALDPTEWLVDQIVAGMPDGTYKDMVANNKAAVTADLNAKVSMLAPNFVTSMKQVEKNFAQMARNFGLNQTFEVSKDGSAYEAKITATGVHFSVDNVETDFAFADHQIEVASAPRVAVSLDASGKLTISDHKLALAYGKMLRLGMDEAVIKAMDPTATDLAMLLQHKVDCTKVGVAILDSLYKLVSGPPGAIFWGDMCNAGLGSAAFAIYTKIDMIEAKQFALALTGAATAVDTNKDSKVDSLNAGNWMGTMSYDGTPAPLAKASFTGSRL